MLQDEKYKEVVVPAKDKFLPALEKFLAESGSGFLVGNTVGRISGPDTK